jgi:hypothetical protein
MVFHEIVHVKGFAKEVSGTWIILTRSNRNLQSTATQIDCTFLHSGFHKTGTGRVQDESTLFSTPYQRGVFENFEMISEVEHRNAKLLSDLGDRARPGGQEKNYLQALGGSERSQQPGTLLWLEWISWHDWPLLRLHFGGFSTSWRLHGLTTFHPGNRQRLSLFIT